MQNFRLALRSFFRKGNGNIIKVISLGTGLAIGIILIAKVCFETSFDTFYPDSDRIYLIKTDFTKQGKNHDFSQVSGAVAPGFKTFVPGVEESTRETFVFFNDKFFTSDKRKISGKCSAADSNFFKVFPRPMLIGDPVKILSTWGEAMVSRTFAEKMGGIDKAIDQQIYNDEIPQLLLTIKGVYEDFPENGIFDDDVLLSLEMIGKGSRDNWDGNNRYVGFVKLAPGVDPQSLSGAVRKMQEAHQNLIEMEKNGTSLRYYLSPLTEIHSGDSRVKSMIVLLSLLAFALIFTAVMNYILIVISSLVRRTKDVGVRKCYGAEGKNIRAIMMTETSLHLLLSLIFAGAIILAFRGLIEELLDASLAALFTPQTLIILLIVCIIVYLISGLIPSYLFMRIPVSTVFRNYKESKRHWKLILLFFQFTATALLLTLLIIIGKQYDRMVNDKPGYEYKNLVYTSLNGVPKSQVSQAMDQLRGLPNVEQVEASYTIPIDWSSGNNIFLPGDPRSLMNISDQYDATEGFFDMMEFKILEGRKPLTPKDVAVSRSFVTAMSKFTDWSDGAIGKDIYVTEHSPMTEHGFDTNSTFTICGVYEDYRIGSINDFSDRPSIRFCNNDSNKNFLVIKLRELNYGSIQEMTELLKTAFPDKDVEVKAYREEMRSLYSDSKKFRDSVLIGGIVTLIIALIGLIGYTNDETTRRSSEIAVRKINGAVVPEILALFIKDILRTGIPAVIVGNIAAVFVARKWLEQFSEKINLSPWYFIISAIAVLLIILAVVVIDCLKIANSNPVKSLKAE